MRPSHGCAPTIAVVGVALTVGIASPALQRRDPELYEGPPTAMP